MNDIVGQGIPIEKTSTMEWMLIPLAFMLISYAIIRHLKTGIIGGVLRQYFSFRLTNQSFNEVNTQSNRLTMALMINSFIAISILFYKLSPIEVLYGNVYLLYGTILLGVLIYFLIKWGLVTLVQGITESGEVLRKSKKYNSQYYEIVGILLLPGIIAMLFFPESTNISIGFFGLENQNIGILYSFFLLVILYVFKLFQSIRQSLDIKVSWYYIILYLCTLEILPLVVIYRLLVGKIWVFN